jgi:(p)ppGpp synthase/HD superfamily hydrolase
MTETRNASLRVGSRFADALVYAANLHALQCRKGGDIPYVSHLLSVAALVLEDGGDENEAIAGLLHDAVEDQGGLPTLDEIRMRFGDQVAEIVHACSDSETLPKPPWKERKEQYIAHLWTADSSVLRVSLADKLHNARAILFDYRQHGDTLWLRFNASAEQTLWYYRHLLEIFRARCPSPMVGELERTVDALERLAGTRTQPEPTRGQPGVVS